MHNKHLSCSSIKAELTALIITVYYKSHRGPTLKVCVELIKLRAQNGICNFLVNLYLSPTNTKEKSNFVA